jgi:hypothetical protein
MSHDTNKKQSFAQRPLKAMLADNMVARDRSLLDLEI